MKNKKRILIAGCGALGSQLTASLLPDLRGEAEITILDFDKVEKRNIQASTQFFLEEQIGMFKTEALQYNLYKWFGKKVDIITKKFEGIIKDWYKYDLTIDCFDNRNARWDVQNFYNNVKEMIKNGEKYEPFGNKIPLKLPNILHCGFSPSMTFEACWAENYKVPSDTPTDFDICDMPGASSFVRLVAAVGANAVLTYIQEGEKKGFVGNRFSVREVK